MAPAEQRQAAQREINTQAAERARGEQDLERRAPEIIQKLQHEAEAEKNLLLKSLERDWAKENLDEIERSEVQVLRTKTESLFATFIKKTKQIGEKISDWRHGRPARKKEAELRRPARSQAGSIETATELPNLQKRAIEILYDTPDLENKTTAALLPVFKAAYSEHRSFESVATQQNDGLETRLLTARHEYEEFKQSLPAEPTAEQQEKLRNLANTVDTLSQTLSQQKRANNEKLKALAHKKDDIYSRLKTRPDFNEKQLLTEIREENEKLRKQPPQETLETLQQMSDAELAQKLDRALAEGTHPYDILDQKKSRIYDEIFTLEKQKNSTEETLAEILLQAQVLQPQIDQLAEQPGELTPEQRVTRGELFAAKENVLQRKAEYQSKLKSLEKGIEHSRKNIVVIEQCLNDLAAGETESTRRYFTEELAETKRFAGLLRPEERGEYFNTVQTVEQLIANTEAYGVQVRREQNTETQRDIHAETTKIINLADFRSVPVASALADSPKNAEERTVTHLPDFAAAHSRGREPHTAAPLETVPVSAAPMPDRATKEETSSTWRPKTTAERAQELSLDVVRKLSMNDLLALPYETREIWAKRIRNDCNETIDDELLYLLDLKHDQFDRKMAEQFGEKNFSDPEAILIRDRWNLIKSLDNPFLHWQYLKKQKQLEGGAASTQTAAKPAQRKSFISGIFGRGKKAA